jgi:hypothetical protein
MRNRNLCLARYHGTIYKVSYPHVEIETRQKWENGKPVLSRTYHTPLGSLSERILLDYDHYYQEVTPEWIVDFRIKEKADYDVARFIVEDAVYEQDYEGFLRLRKFYGEDGILFAVMGRSPLQKLSIEWTGLERLVYDLQDHPAVVEDLIQVMTERFDEIYQLAAHSPAEVVWSPDNISTTRTSPHWFKRYCLPFYNRQAPQLHQGGKLYSVHMDGPVGALKDLITECDIDVIDGLVPPPMGDLPLLEAQRAWPDKAIISSFPTSLFYEGRERAFACALEQLKGPYRNGRFVLGFTEDIPEEHLEDGLKTVADAILAFERMGNS